MFEEEWIGLMTGELEKCGLERTIYLQDVLGLPLSDLQRDELANEGQ